MTLYCLNTKRLITEDKVEFEPKCKFEGKNYIARGTYLNSVKMGIGSYIGMNCMLRSVKIEKYTCIGPNVTVAIGRHPVRDFVSTHPAFFSTNHPIGFSYVKQKKFNEVKYAIDNENEKYAIYIGNDVWIGAGVTITDGVSIGDGAIVGANSLVLNDVEPYSIVVGIPAKEIRKRFSSDDISFLIKTEWWKKEEKWIEDNADAFDSLTLFRKRIEIRKSENNES